MDEFAMGASNETSVYGPARNPYHTDRIPGGSSGGSAAALAAGMTPIALGTDTGGSVRQPAALCGTIGRKPSYGRYSRYGLIAMASSFDQLGVFGHTVDDVRKIDTILAHHDPRDATSVAYTHTSYPSDRTLRLALPRQYCSDTLDPQIAEKL
jgi:aspartyl-tRNA(Asn)/glutamyl-tRNA(Gln) amidotransferase subunit A